MSDSRPKAAVTFSKPIARRIGRVVKRVEAQYARPPDQRQDRNLVPFVPIQPARVTTAIPSGTLSAISNTGRVTIYRDDDAGGLAPAETDQECRNFHTLTASVPIGTTISCYWRANAFWLVQPDCY